MRRTAACVLALGIVFTLTITPRGIAATTAGAAITRVQNIANVQQRFQLKQASVASCSDLSLQLQWGQSNLRYRSDGDLVISGVDQRGRTYQAVKATNISGCEIWSADLDGTGEQDLIILTPGEDSSGGYDTELSILFFDKNGYPFPWQATGKFTSNKDGVVQIVSAPSPTSHAGVIVPTKEGLAGPSANLAFQLYAFSPMTVAKISGKAMGVTWPAFANPTPQLIVHQKADFLSFNRDAPTLPERLIPSTSYNRILSANSELTLGNGQQVKPPAILVEDGANGSRVIDFDPVPSDIEKLLSQSAQVTPMGQSCDAEECRPLIWITQP